MSPLAGRTPQRLRTHERWLAELTAIPTASGREDRVIEWVLTWVRRRRRSIGVAADPAGNLFLHQGPVTARTGRIPAHRPLLITAHLDHPAFVLREVLDARRVRMEFRGGVHDPYFEGAALEIVDRSERSRGAKVIAFDGKAKPFKQVTAEVRGGTRGLDLGDIGRWALPRPRVVKRGGSRLIETHACDDLAAVAAALACFDSVAGRRGFEHVGVLLTVAEEVGFIGAIATARVGGVPRDARLICLENSRSFTESPIGAGAILRVGDRLSVFSPALTNRLGEIYLDHQKRDPSFRFQRKLMPGGACEATAFAAYGFESTCLCLPLGNYHNMVDIDGVLGGTQPAKLGPEFISLDDFHGLVVMLLIAAARLDGAEVPTLRERMELIYAESKSVVAALA
jgi:endoglucanase